MALTNHQSDMFDRLNIKSIQGLKDKRVSDLKDIESPGLRFVRKSPPDNFNRYSVIDGKAQRQMSMIGLVNPEMGQKDLLRQYSI